MQICSGSQSTLSRAPTRAEALSSLVKDPQVPMLSEKASIEAINISSEIMTKPICIHSTEDGLEAPSEKCFQSHSGAVAPQAPALSDLTLSYLKALALQPQQASVVPSDGCKVRRMRKQAIKHAQAKTKAGSESIVQPKQSL